MAQVKTNFEKKRENRNEMKNKVMQNQNIFPLITILRNGMEINNNKYLRSRSRLHVCAF